MSEALRFPQGGRRALGYLKQRGSIGALLFVAILAVAGFLRMYKLGEVPPGLHYDEGANALLSSAIAKGESRPIFIEPYCAREVLFFYLAAGVMRLLGPTLFALRLTAALVATLTVAVTYQMTKEVALEEDWAAQWMALGSAALLATSFWHLTFSRYGFRAITQPFVQGLTLTCLWRGLRRRSGRWMALGGICFGLTGYTYPASRVFPLALVPVFGVLFAGDSRKRRKTAAHLGIFLLMALVIFAPLGIYFLKHPAYFSVRMSQLSPLQASSTSADLKGLFWRATLRVAAMFSFQGENYWRYNIPGKPIFPWAVSILFYLGIAHSLVRLVRARGALERGTHLMILMWLPIMQLPNLLAAESAPSSVRALGLIPLLFVLPAQGLSVILKALRRAVERLSPKATRLIGPGALILLLTLGGMATWRDYFRIWANCPLVYYYNEAELRAAARYLNELDTERMDIIMSAVHYRHPSVAFLAGAYSKIRWLIGRRVMVLPGKDGAATLYLFPHQAQPEEALLNGYFSLSQLVKESYGPDGEVDFAAYLLHPKELLPPSPQFPASTNLGNVLEFIGYDLGGAPVAGSILDLTLYWRVLKEAEIGDYSVFLRVLDQWGNEWGGEDFFTYPSEQWRSGEIILNRCHIPLSPLVPPGEYHFRMGVYSPSRGERLPKLDEAGRVAGTTIVLKPFKVARPSITPQVASIPVQNPRHEDLGPAITFLGYDLASQELQPGQILRLSLYWMARQRVAADYDLILQLRDERGETLLLWKGRPVHGTFPTVDWQAGLMLKDPYQLPIPRQLRDGSYVLETGLLDRATGLPLPNPEGVTTLPLETLQVQARARRFTIPPIPHPLKANLGGQVELLGYKLDSDAARPGGPLYLTLYWRALEEMETSYTVFTHLLDQRSIIWGQRDNPPLSGSYPTTLWVKGEVVSDQYEIPVRPDAPLGEYVIEIGMYVAETGQRLSALGEEGRVQGDRVLLGSVRIVGE